MFATFLYLWEGMLFLVSYVRKGKVFPEPLTQEKETKYINQMQKGDNQARNLLIKHNLRLVAHIVKKYSNSRTDTEDLISIGTIGLIKGINTYDDSKNTKLATYAARCVENEILMHLRSNKRKNQEKFLQESIGSDKEGNEIKLMDIISNEDESILDKVEKNINCERLYELLDQLSEREKTVLELRYGLGGKKKLTQREVAGILDISRSNVSRIEKKAVENLTGLFKKKI